MRYSSLMVVLTGTLALIFRKIITCAALEIQEYAVESVWAHLIAIYKHYLVDAFWNSLSNAGLMNTCHTH